MPLTLTREDILDPLQKVIGVVERKQAVAILSNVLLTTADNKLSITGTDQEIELISQASLPALMHDFSDTTVPGRKLLDICKALPEGAPIELSHTKEKLVLKSGRSRFTLSTLPSKDFPNLDELVDELAFSIKQKDILYLLKQTCFAMAQQDVRYYLNGLLLELTSTHIRAVATDGHRMAMATVAANTPAEAKIQAIIPRKAALELMRLMTDTDETVKLSIGKAHIRIVTPSYVFTSKLVDGRFPEYERVIPKNGRILLSIDRDALKQALSRSAILCNEKFKGIRFELSNNKLKLHANNPEQEIAEEELAIDYSAEEINTGFNVYYLLDALNVVEDGPVKLIFAEPNGSMLIEEQTGNAESSFVVMPLRL